MLITFVIDFRFTNAHATMQVIVKGFMGTAEEAIKYIDRGYYIGLTGYLCKVSVSSFIVFFYKSHTQ